MSAAPSSAPANTPAAPADLDALEAELADDKKLDAAVARADALLANHEALLEDARAKAAIRKVLVAAGRVMHPKTAELFERVGTSQGAAGPDLIYQLLESSGRARWAKLAERTLASEAVRKLATPELQIAFDLRFAPCNEKIPLVDVAAERGDARSIVVLDLQARGCFKDTSKVDEALAKLRLRLKKKG